MSIKRSLTSRLLVALGACLLALVLAEVGLRISGYGALEGKGMTGKRGFVLRPSALPELVYEPTPGASGRVWKCDVSINSSGFRDRERQHDKAPGITRVVALGDSITFGNHLDIADTWPSVLERLCTDSDAPVEVLNLGVGGYDTAQEVLFLESVGLAFRPDYVFVAVCVNDVATVSLNLEEFNRARELRSGLTRHSRLARWLAVAMGRRSLHEEMERRRMSDVEGAHPSTTDPAIRKEIEIVRNVVERSARTNEPLEPSQVGLQILDWYTEPARIARVRRAFERLARLAEEHDFEVVVFVVPFLEDEDGRQQSAAWRAVYAILEHEARRLEYGFVDMHEPFVEAGIESLRRRPKDPVHPGTRGHRLIGETLLRETGIGGGE